MSGPRPFQDPFQSDSSQCNQPVAVDKVTPVFPNPKSVIQTLRTHPIKQRPAGPGRKKGKPNNLTGEIKALAAQYGPEALATLINLLRHSSVEQVRLAAARELLDRGYGRPAQAIGLYREQNIQVIVDRSSSTQLAESAAGAILNVSVQDEEQE